MKKIIFILFLGIMFAVSVAAQTGDYIGNLGDLGETSVYLAVHKDAKPESPAVVVNEISNEKLEESGAKTVAEALDKVAGIDTRNSDKGQNFINIRGFKQQDLKVLIDGVPAYESYFGLVDLSVIPTDSIEKITVTKGACSVLYGPNTMGGVVNIITKKGTGEPKTSLLTSFGDFKMFNYGLNQCGRFDKINYNLGYSRQSADGWGLSDNFDKNNPRTGISSDYREDGGIRENSDYEKQSFVGNIGYVPNDTLKTNLSVNWINQEKGIPIQNLMGTSQSARFTDWNQWQLSLAGEKTLSMSASLKGRIFYVGHTDELITDTTATLAMVGRPWFDKSVYNDYSMGGELNSYLNLLEDNLTKIGVNYQKDRHNDKDFDDWNWSKRNNIWTYTITPGWSSEKKYEADTYCIGLEDSLMSINKLTVNFGGGCNGFVPIKSAGSPHPGDTWILTPQIGADYDITSNTTLYGSIGKKVRFPRMKELYSKIAGGNPNLEAEQTIAPEVGVRQKINDVKIYASYFDNHVSKLINSQRNASGNSYYVNIGKSRIYGAETGADAPITDRLSVSGNYTYLYAFDITNNIELAQQPRHKINLSTGYKFPFGLSACIEGVYTGRQKIYSPAKRTAQDYALVNLKMSQKITPVKSGSPELFASVDNVFDRDYEEGDGPMQGRSFTTGLRYTW